MADQERVPARPEGQLAIDKQKDRLINRAADRGWKCTSRDPLTLTKGGRSIEVEYGSAGMPKSAKWLGGDEFKSMDSSGMFYLNVLNGWLLWRPHD